MTKAANLLSEWPENWTKVVQCQKVQNALNGIGEAIQEDIEKDILCPPKQEIFRALSSLSPEKVKVVILGQDPYPTRGHAHGLAFSANKEVKPFPKSLQNIFKEVESCYPNSTFDSADLSHWVDQGVLLLNASLSTREGKPLAHQDLDWDIITDGVLKYLNEQEAIVFLLWGKFAQKKELFIDKAKHLVLKTSHPSPLSSYRGFLGSQHFLKANEFLVKNERGKILW
jgi:uracil-DNA glycosylase